MASPTPTSNNETYTVGKLSNLAQPTISLKGNHVWNGFKHTDFPQNIGTGDEVDFTHLGKSEDNQIEGSEACLVYELPDGKKWIVAWSNPFEFYKRTENKVYTDIVQQPIHMNEIQAALHSQGKQSMDKYLFGYHAHADIDEYTNTPTMRASIEALVERSIATSTERSI
ncbi:hypothetical protein V6N13_138469 [Hibiscus sabdariffa]